MAREMSTSESYGKNDILCGRGGLTNHHPGNRVYRRLVSHNKKRYENLNQSMKVKLVESMLMALKSQGARFLKMDKASRKWVEISDKDALGKTTQALRETERPRRASFTSTASGERLQQSFASQDRTSDEEDEGSFNDSGFYTDISDNMKSVAEKKEDGQIEAQKTATVATQASPPESSSALQPPQLETGASLTSLALDFLKATPNKDRDCNHVNDLTETGLSISALSEGKLILPPNSFKMGSSHLSSAGNKLSAGEPRVVSTVLSNSSRQGDAVAQTYGYAQNYSNAISAGAGQAAEEQMSTYPAQSMQSDIFLSPIAPVDMKRATNCSDGFMTMPPLAKSSRSLISDDDDDEYDGGPTSMYHQSALEAVQLSGSDNDALAMPLAISRIHSLVIEPDDLNGNIKTTQPSQYEPLPPSFQRAHSLADSVLVDVEPLEQPNHVPAVAPYLGANQGFGATPLVAQPPSGSLTIQQLQHLQQTLQAYQQHVQQQIDATRFGQAVTEQRKPQYNSNSTADMNIQQQQWGSTRGQGFFQSSSYSFGQYQQRHEDEYHTRGGMAPTAFSFYHNQGGGLEQNFSECVQNDGNDPLHKFLARAL